MQTIEFIKTAQWILDRFNDRTVKALQFMNSIENLPAKLPDDEVENIYQAAIEIANASPILLNNSMAVDIIAAFDIKLLIDPVLPGILGRMIVSRKIEAENCLVWQEFARNWDAFARFIKAVEGLTIPANLRGGEHQENVFSLEMYMGEYHNIPGINVATTIAALNEAYWAAVLLHGEEKPELLKLFHADCGTWLRLDFRGKAKPLRFIKEFFLQVTRLISKHGAIKVAQKSRKLMDVLPAFKEIERLAGQGSPIEGGIQSIKDKFSPLIDVIVNYGATIYEIRDVSDLEKVPHPLQNIPDLRQMVIK